MHYRLFTLCTPTDLELAKLLDASNFQNSNITRKFQEVSSIPCRSAVYFADTYMYVLYTRRYTQTNSHTYLHATYNAFCLRKYTPIHYLH